MVVGVRAKVVCETLRGHVGIKTQRNQSVKHLAPSKQVLCTFHPLVKPMWGVVLKVDKLFTSMFKLNVKCIHRQPKLVHRLPFAQM